MHKLPHHLAMYIFEVVAYSFFASGRKVNKKLTKSILIAIVSTCIAIEPATLYLCNIK